MKKNLSLQQTTRKTMSTSSTQEAQRSDVRIVTPFTITQELVRRFLEPERVPSKKEHNRNAPLPKQQPKRNPVPSTSKCDGEKSAPKRVPCKKELNGKEPLPKQKSHPVPSKCEGEKSAPKRVPCKTELNSKEPLPKQGQKSHPVSSNREGEKSVAGKQQYTWFSRTYAWLTHSLETEKQLRRSSVSKQTQNGFTYLVNSKPSIC